jgi:hypothetical protein
VNLSYFEMLLLRQGNGSLDLHTVVQVASLVFHLSLFFIDYPILIVDHILVEMLTLLQRQSNEPLICDVVKAHGMSLLPVVKGATNLDHVMAWPSIVQHEVGWNSLPLNLVELRLHIPSCKDQVNVTRSRAQVRIIHIHLRLLTLTNHLIKDVDRLVAVWIPLLELSLTLNHGLKVHIDLASQPIELIQPSLAHRLTWHGGIECIHSQLGILLLVAKSAKCSFNSEDEVLLLIAFKGVATADFAVPLELNHRVLQSTCLERNDGG